MKDFLSNRKIRFWDSAYKKMIYAEQAANDHSLLAVGLHGTPIVLDADSFKKEGEIVGWNVDHNRFRMDAIGRVDSASKQIYEFDILSTNGVNRVVRYNPVIPGYGLSFLTGGTTSIPDDVTIVGNFFENPDLLS